MGSHKGEIPFQTKPRLPYALAALETHSSLTYIVYKLGGDPGDYQFFNEPPKQIPHGYVCAYVPDYSNPIRAGQHAVGGASGMDVEKQAWLAKYVTGPAEP